MQHKPSLSGLPTKPVMSRRSVVGGSAAVLALGAIGGKGVLAQQASPVASSEVQAEVLLTGLADPRYLVVDGDTVLFTEAGTGGDTPVNQMVGEGTPEPASPVSMVGNTGKLSRLNADGSVDVIVDDFVSYTFGQNGEIVGASGVAVNGAGLAYVSVGAPGPFIDSISLTGQEDAVFAVDLATGEKTLLGGTAEIELSQNPDPATVDSNLYDIAVLDGVIYIADSGGNVIYSLPEAGGEPTVLAVTGGFPVDFLPETGNPLRGGAQEIDSVPSGLAAGPDGRIYASFLTGGPFPAGESPIISYAPDGSSETFATGLTAVVGLAFSSDGTLYGTVLSTDFVGGGPGQVVRIMADGNHVVVVDGLQFPNGLAFDANDNLYLLNKVSFGLGGGELVRYSGVTTATGTPWTLPAPQAPSTDATPVASPVVGASEPVHVSFVDIAFEPSALTIPADTDVTLTFENRGALPHDFVIDDPAVNSGLLAAGETGLTVVNLPAGTYTFYCTQVGHRAAGMEGTLTVE